MRIIFGIATIAVALTAFYTFSSYKDTTTMTEKNPPKIQTLVALKTTLGDIKLELFHDKAPVTVENFLQYVSNGHFAHTIFHRVIDGFMIQGGGFTKEMEQKPTLKPIKNEATNGLRNKRGTIAMARTQDVNSATAQFFINVSDNAFLDNRGTSPQEYGYCVFGTVIEGMDVVDKIKSVKTGSRGPYQDVPAQAIEILEAKVL